MKGTIINRDNFGKRSRVNITRAGVVTEEFFVCYFCPAELSEEEAAQHNCQDKEEGIQE